MNFFLYAKFKENPKMKPKRICLENTSILCGKILWKSLLKNLHDNSDIQIDRVAHIFILI